jgi:hypothetical protein
MYSCSVLLLHASCVTNSKLLLSYEFLPLQIGKRGEEARDMARYALRNPWWSLGHFDATRSVSELQGDAKQVHWQLSAEATEASTSQVTGFQYKEPRTEQEVRGTSDVAFVRFDVCVWRWLPWRLLVCAGVRLCNTCHLLGRSFAVCEPVGVPPLARSQASSTRSHAQSRRWVGCC